MKWWQKEERPLGYVSYNIENTEVIIGRRLDRSGCDPVFFKSINGFISLTESYIEYPNDVNFRWFPWKEGIDIFPDYVIFAGLKTLQQWIFNDKLSRIYIHCDLGSHRAPSLFGAFLKAFFTEEKAKEIVANFKLTNNEESRYCADGKLRNNPLEYIERKFEELPSLIYLIKAIVEHPNDDLSDIVTFKLKEYLPDNLLSKKDLSERKNNRQRIAFTNKVKEVLIKKGFLFDSNNYSEFHAILNNDDYFIYIVNLKHSNVPYGIIHAKLSQNKKVLLISNKNDIITNTEFIDYCVSKIGKFYKYELSLKKVE